MTRTPPAGRDEALVALPARSRRRSRRREGFARALAHGVVVVDDQDARHGWRPAAASAGRAWAQGAKFILRRPDTLDMKGLTSALVIAIAAVTACSSPPSRAALPSRPSAAPRMVRVGVSEGGGTKVRLVPLEDYVEATILSEFAPAGGDPAVVERMLEVQAVVGRTYAIGHLGRHAREGYESLRPHPLPALPARKIEHFAVGTPGGRGGTADGVRSALVRWRTCARGISRRLWWPYERRSRGMGGHCKAVSGEPARRWRCRGSPCIVAL